MEKDNIKKKRRPDVEKFRKPKPSKLPRKKSLHSNSDGTIVVNPMLYANHFQFYETCGGYLSLYPKDGQYLVSANGIAECAPRSLYVLMNDTGRVEFHQLQLFDISLRMLEAGLSRPFRYEDLEEYRRSSKAMLEGKPRPSQYNRDNWVRPFDVKTPCPLKPQEDLIKTYFEGCNKNIPKSEKKTL